VSLSHHDFDAFLAHIAETPEDHFRRLVFADWLQDCDDPRAAWFRHEQHFWRPAWRTWLVADLDECIRGVLNLERFNPYLDDPAWTILVAIGSPTIPVLRAWMRSTDANDIPPWAYDLLHRFPPPELQPVAELIDRLSQPDLLELSMTILDLGWHGANAEPAVGALCDLLSRNLWPDSTVARYSTIVRSLGRIGRPVETIVPVLMRSLGTDDTHSFANLFGTVGVETERIVLALRPTPALVYANLQLQDARCATTSLRILAAVSEGDRTWFVHALTQYPRPRVFDAAMAVAATDPTLSRALLDHFGTQRQHANPEMRRFAHRISLIHSDREETVRLLSEAMASDDSRIVADAERGMLTSQTQSLELVAEVVERMIAARVSVPGSFVTGLRVMGKRALPVLRLLLGDGSASIRRSAALSLHEAGPRGRILLQDALDDPRKIVREAADGVLR